MTRRLDYSVAAAGVCFTCLAIPLLFAFAFTSAAAAAGCHSQVAVTSYLISLRGSHRYSVVIETDRRGRVELSAGRAGQGVVYRVHGTVKPHRLRARFGRLGRIALRISSPRHSPFETERVTLEGRISFRGEEGFTSVSRRRLKGTVFRTFKTSCGATGRAGKASASESSVQKRVTFVAAAERSAARAVLVGLRTSDPPDLEEDGGGDYVDALLQERREGMSIERLVHIEGPAAAGAGSPFKTEPLSGSVSAPPPFHGTASYSKGSDSGPLWSGDLRVSFPGASDVPLTGPGFSAVACSAAISRAVDACQDEASRLVQRSLLFPFFF